jgi:hypothetical protein
VRLRTRLRAPRARALRRASGRGGSHGAASCCSVSGACGRGRRVHGRTPCAYPLGLGECLAGSGQVGTSACKACRTARRMLQCFCYAFAISKHISALKKSSLRQPLPCQHERAMLARGRKSHSCRHLQQGQRVCCERAEQGTMWWEEAKCNTVLEVHGACSPPHRAAGRALPCILHTMQNQHFIHMAHFTHFQLHRVQLPFMGRLASPRQCLSGRLPSWPDLDRAAVELAAGAALTGVRTPARACAP